MTDVTNPSRLGLQQGGSDNLQLFRILYGQDYLTAFEENNWMAGLTQHKMISGGKSHEFPVLGRSKATRHTVGENLGVPDISNSGANAAKQVNFAKTTVRVYIDESSHQHGFDLEEIDTLLTDDSGKERASFASDQVRAILENVELTWKSSLLLTAMCVDTLKSAEMASSFTGDALLDSTGKNFTRRKAVAALKAGLTDSALSVSTTVDGQTYLGNSFGYHIDTGATARAIKSVLWKLANYFDHLRIPKAGRRFLMGLPQYYILAESDDRYTTGAGSMVEKNRDVGGTGYAGGLAVPPIAGWEIIPDPYLTGTVGTGFGTQLETNFTATPTTNDERKYQPYDKPQTNKLFANNLVIQTMVQQHAGGLASQPNTWAEWRNLYDKVWGIGFVPSALGTVHAHEMKTGSQYDLYRDVVATISRYYCGHGILRPEAACYVASARVTTA